MKLMFTIAGGVILAFVLLTAGCAALIGSAADSSSVHNPKGHGGSVSKIVEKATGTDQAQQSAEDYLDGPMAFSRSSLIHQLKFEGYSAAEATSAVDSVSVDWNAQAVKSAQGYLDGPMSFSRSGLIDQLKFEGFTPSQAAYGVGQVYG